MLELLVRPSDSAAANVLISETARRGLPLWSSSGFIGYPILAKSAKQRVKHLIAGMLRELDVHLIRSQREDVNAGLDRRLCQLLTLFWWTSLTDVAHQERRLIGLTSRATPDPAFRELADGDRDIAGYSLA
jgi:hypothetical protein